MNDKADESYFHNYKAVLRPTDRYHSYVDYEFTLLKPIHKIAVQVKMFTCYNDCHPFLINLKVNLCQFDGKANNYYTNMFHRIFQNSDSNIPFGICPYKKGFYYARNVSASVNIFKMLPIPDNIYKMSSNYHITEGEETIWVLNSSVRFNLYNKKDLSEKRPRTKKCKT